jgi:hypothetical protein
MPAALLLQVDEPGEQHEEELLRADLGQAPALAHGDGVVGRVVAQAAGQAAGEDGAHSGQRVHHVHEVVVGGLGSTGEKGRGRG